MRICRFSKPTNQVKSTKQNKTNEDRLNIRNNEETDDFTILQAMNLLQKQYPTITTQPPSLAFSTGFSYFPSETVQITHTGAYHRVLLSSMYSKIVIYDSLNLQPTDFLLFCTIIVCQILNRLNVMNKLEVHKLKHKAPYFLVIW